MNKINELFNSELKVVNLGMDLFKEDISLQHTDAVQVKWNPPGGGDPKLIEALGKLQDNEKVDQANDQALDIMMNSRLVLRGVARAIDVVPGMTPKTILHAGPPIKFEDMPGPMKGAVIGALIFEGLAEDPDKAVELATSGEIIFDSCHDHQMVGAMTGVTSANMIVHVVQNETYGNFGYSTIHEGSGYTVQRYGSWDEGVIRRLKWLESEFRPVLNDAIERSGGIDVGATIAQALHMSDECHNRNKASSILFYRQILPFLLDTDYDKDVIKRVSEFINSNEHYHLSITMAASKAQLDAATGIEHCSIVTALSRNGSEFGIKVSGLGKDTWLTGKAQLVDGLFFPGYSQADSTPDMGDSSIAETAGLGGFSLGNAPAIVQFVGGTVADALSYVKKMYEVTWSENKNYTIPFLNFRGTPAGVDIRKVIETGILPIITTGIAHKERGKGQIGAGIANPPMECFEKAIVKLAEKE
ncbi:DUF1116 domain-containing protein [Proteiniclasticum aestuarii]|nr:DUF1116 domain-containing protein [Proteiniclasticum aestuarii]